MSVSRIAVLCFIVTISCSINDSRAFAGTQRTGHQHSTSVARQGSVANNERIDTDVWALTYQAISQKYTSTPESKVDDRHALGDILAWFENYRNRVGEPMLLTFYPVPPRPTVTPKSRSKKNVWLVTATFQHGTVRGNLKDLQDKYRYFYRNGRDLLTGMSYDMLGKTSLQHDDPHRAAAYFAKSEGLSPSLTTAIYRAFSLAQAGKTDRATAVARSILAGGKKNQLSRLDRILLKSLDVRLQNPPQAGRFDKVVWTKRETGVLLPSDVFKIEGIVKSTEPQSGKVSVSNGNTHYQLIVPPSTTLGTLQDQDVDGWSLYKSSSGIMYGDLQAKSHPANRPAPNI